MSEFIRYITRNNWFIGFIDASEFEHINEGAVIHYVQHKYKDRWFADPFIYDVTDSEIIVLAEEMRFRPHRGRIVRLAIDKSSYALKDMTVLLDLDTHLSFPAIVRIGDDVYIHPENAESGNLKLYLYDDRNRKLVFQKVINESPVSDAVITDDLGTPCMIATTQPNSNGKVVDFFEAESLTDNYHKVQSIQLGDKSARGAGAVFEHNGMLIRPAQLYDKVYGRALCFQIISKDERGYSVKEYIRKYPPAQFVGMHTYNQYKGIVYKLS